MAIHLIQDAITAMVHLVLIQAVITAMALRLILTQVVWMAEGVLQCQKGGALQEVEATAIHNILLVIIQVQRPVQGHVLHAGSKMFNSDISVKAGFCIKIKSLLQRGF